VAGGAEGTSTGGGVTGGEVTGGDEGTPAGGGVDWPHSNAGVHGRTIS